MTGDGVRCEKSTVSGEELFKSLKGVKGEESVRGWVREGSF